MKTTGYLTEIVDKQGFKVFVPFSDTQIIQKQEITEVDVKVSDGRTISPKQRRKVFALISDITEYVTAPMSNKRSRAEMETLREMQLLYILDCLSYFDKSYDKELIRRQLTQAYCNILDVELFSLSNIDISTARDFIDWLVELCIIHGIPCIDSLLNRCEDIYRYVYACVANRRCVICGKPADIHHLEGSRVGMGRDRTSIDHTRLWVLALCRIHHDELHGSSEADFLNKHHLEGIQLDEYLVDLLNL